MESVVRSTQRIEKQQVAQVCVVLPVYNEAANIDATFEAVWDFSTQHSDYRFVFVNDGSTDETKGILESKISQSEAAKIELISYQHRRGKGWAVRKGISQAEGDYVCFIDGDLAYSLEHLEFLVEKLETHDVVIGCRNLAPVNLKDVEPFRRLSGKIFNWASRKILNLEFRDMQAGLKGFRVAIVHSLLKNQQVFGFAVRCRTAFLGSTEGAMRSAKFQLLFPRTTSKKSQRSTFSPIRSRC